MDASKIHFMWWQGRLEMPELFQKTVRLWKELNPESTIIVWDEAGVMDFVRSRFPDFVDIFDGMPGTTEGAKTIKKCDLARMLILYTYGGVYADCDLEPINSIDSLLSSGVIYDRYAVDTQKLPKIASQDDLPEDPELILSREYFKIDTVGRGVANGIILAKESSQVIRRFIYEHALKSDNRVLDYMGTWAWTRHLREFIKSNPDQSRVVILPPYYFLWSDQAMKQKPPHYTISKHHGSATNSWGDKSDPHYYLV